MADNITLNAGSGGSKVKTDDDGTAHWTYVKLAYGADNTQTRVTAAAPLPVGANTVKDGSGTLLAPLVDSDGHFQIDVLSCASHAVTNAGTFAVQVDGTALTRLTDIETNTDFGAVTGGGVEASALRVTIASDSTGVLSIDDNGGSVTVDNAALSVTGGGVEASALRVTIASDSTGVVSVDDNGSTISVDDGAGSLTVDNGGTFVVQIDGTALTRLTDIETNTDFGAVVGGGVEASALRVTIASDSTGVVSIDDNGGSVTADLPAVATGGCDSFRSIDLDESEEEVKATAGTLYGGVVINLKASVLYLKFYNATAANVTVGTTTPVLTIPIPTPGSTNGAGFTIPIPACGVKFDTAITVACTTGLADNDTGAPGANECVVNLFYK